MRLRHILQPKELVIGAAGGSDGGITGGENSNIRAGTGITIIIGRAGSRVIIIHITGYIGIVTAYIGFDIAIRITGCISLGTSTFLVAVLPQAFHCPIVYKMGTCKGSIWASRFHYVTAFCG